MKRLLLLACLSLLLLPSCAQTPQVGAYQSASVTDQNVAAAARFAVAAQQKAEPGKGAMELVRITRAEQQVVAGMNFHLRLQVRQGSTLRTAEAVVWWQAWRKPAPYELTSWKWL